VRGMPASGANSSGGDSGASGNGRQVRISRQPRGTPFDRFAETASQFVSKGLFFTIAVVVVAIWMPTIFLFGSVDTWQLVINTLTSVLAFLLIALLQNSERRYDHALHHKVDVLAQALATVMRHQVEADSAAVRRSIDELNAAIGLERKV
jgi:low affinity Fe/Cu permease